MMNEKELNALIARYMEGETTCEEERRLEAYFQAHADVDEPLRPIRQLVLGLGALGANGSPGSEAQAQPTAHLRPTDSRRGGEPTAHSRTGADALQKPKLLRGHRLWRARQRPRADHARSERHDEPNQQTEHRGAPATRRADDCGITEKKRLIMKKIKHLLVLVAALAPLSLAAQTGLAVNRVFQGLVVPQKQMVEVKVKGRALSEYRLNFYHSVRFTATKPQKATIDALVAADRRSAKGTEERKKGRNASTILTLPQRGKTNRFLCYLTKQKGRAVVTTLAYMEGSVSNIDELRRLIE